LLSESHRFIVRSALYFPLQNIPTRMDVLVNSAMFVLRSCVCVYMADLFYPSRPLKLLWTQPKLLSVSVVAVKARTSAAACKYPHDHCLSKVCY
jgi:hypothetical protein